MNQQVKKPDPITIFYSYASQDEEMQERLEQHLSLLKRQNLLTEWHNRKILPGSERDETINMYLNTSSLILLLVSPDYLASDYCYSVEMERAMARHQAGDARVIPIILRPVNWERAPFAKLEPLPRDSKPITLWANQDAAFLDVTNGILKVIEYLQSSFKIPQQPSLSLKEILAGTSASQEKSTIQAQPVSPAPSQPAGMGKYTVQNFGTIQGFVQSDNAQVTFNFTNNPQANKQESLPEQQKDENHG